MSLAGLDRTTDALLQHRAVQLGNYDRVRASLNQSLRDLRHNMLNTRMYCDDVYRLKDEMAALAGEYVRHESALQALKDGYQLQARATNDMTASAREFAERTQAVVAEWEGFLERICGSIDCLQAFQEARLSYRAYLEALRRLASRVGLIRLLRRLFILSSGIAGWVGPSDAPAVECGSRHALLALPREDDLIMAPSTRQLLARIASARGQLTAAKSIIAVAMLRAEECQNATEGLQEEMRIVTAKAQEKLVEAEASAEASAQAQARLQELLPSVEATRLELTTTKETVEALEGELAQARQALQEQQKAAAASAAAGQQERDRMSSEVALAEKRCRDAEEAAKSKRIELESLELSLAQDYSRRLQTRDNLLKFRELLREHNGRSLPLLERLSAVSAELRQLQAERRKIQDMTSSIQQHSEALMASWALEQDGLMAAEHDQRLGKTKEEEDQWTQLRQLAALSYAALTKLLPEHALGHQALAAEESMARASLCLQAAESLNAAARAQYIHQRRALRQQQQVRDYGHIVGPSPRATAKGQLNQSHIANTPVTARRAGQHPACSFIIEVEEGSDLALDAWTPLSRHEDGEESELMESASVVAMKIARNPIDSAAPAIPRREAALTLSADLLAEHNRLGKCGLTTGKQIKPVLLARGNRANVTVASKVARRGDGPLLTQSMLREQSGESGYSLFPRETSVPVVLPGPAAMPHPTSLQANKGNLPSNTLDLRVNEIVGFGPNDPANTFSSAQSVPKLRAVNGALETPVASTPSGNDNGNWRGTATKRRKTPRTTKAHNNTSDPANADPDGKSPSPRRPNRTEGKQIKKTVKDNLNAKQALPFVADMKDTGSRGDALGSRVLNQSDGAPDAVGRSGAVLPDKSSILINNSNPVSSKVIGSSARDGLMHASPFKESTNIVASTRSSGILNTTIKSSRLSSKAQGPYSIIEGISPIRGSDTNNQKGMSVSHGNISGTLKSGATHLSGTHDTTHDLPSSLAKPPSQVLALGQGAAGRGSAQNNSLNTSSSAASQSANTSSNASKQANRRSGASSAHSGSTSKAATNSRDQKYRQDTRPSSSIGKKRLPDRDEDPFDIFALVD